MRDLVVIAGLAGAVSGCQLRDVFSARADVAAEAGAGELSAERLGTILAGPKNLQPTRESAELVTNLWIDYALVAQAIARGEDLTDSATIAQAMWPELAELKGAHWHDTLTARRGVLPDGAIDQAYGGDSLRVFQHILFRLAQTATPEERQQALAQANTTLQRVRGGGDFGALAQELSGDGSASDQGFLPPSPRGAFVPAFDSAAWALAPGGVSNVVETPFGYHIIRRPALDQVRDRLRQHLVQVASGRLDSVYMDSLARANDLELHDEAVSRIRAAVQAPPSAEASNRTVATFEGGTLTVADVMRWVRALPPQYQQQIVNAGDDDLRGFARVLGQNTLLLREADRNNIAVTAEEWQDVRGRYTMLMDSLRAELRLNDLADSTASEQVRVETALLKVDQYFDRLVNGQGRLIPLPAALGVVLREDADVEVNEAGLARAVQYAVRERGDSAAAPFTQAPGGAPIPGAMQGQGRGGAPIQPGGAPPAQPAP